MPGTVKISRETWNEIAKLLRSQGIRQSASFGSDAGGVIVERALNTDATAIGRYDVVSLTGVMVTSGSDAFFERKYGFTCKRAVKSDNMALGVAIEPIGANAIGKVGLVGHCAVKVNVTNTFHKYAVPGSTAGQLDSAETGPFRIVWKAGSSGVMWTVAVFPQAASARSAEWFMVTGVYDDYLMATHKIVSGTGWVDGPLGSTGIALHPASNKNNYTTAMVRAGWAGMDAGWIATDYTNKDAVTTIPEIPDPIQFVECPAQ